MGGQIQPGDFGPLSQAAQHFSTLRETLQSIARFHSLVSQAIKIDFEEQESIGILHYKIILPTAEDIRQDVELSLAMFAAGCRQEFEDSWNPVEVTFTHPKPSNTDKYHQMFGEKVSFGQPHNTIVYHKKDLDKQLTDKDDKSRQRFSIQLQDLMDDVLREETLLANTRYYIDLTLSTEHCDAASVAHLMHMSRRTLTRHLTNMETSFRKLKEDIILEKAKQKLSSPCNSTGTIALDLGFSDSTAFSRAFKKLCQLTPSQYRDNVLKEKQSDR